MEGTVFNIQRFSVEDGPGIRTNVFLKGCPLRCAWCHNPESQSVKPEIFYSPDKCIGCGWCVSACPNGCHVFTPEGHLFDRTKCVKCGKCTEKCYAEALESCGKTMNADEVLQEVLKDRAFYQTSGGGITITGGEPFAQAEFMLELARLAKEEGLNTCMETSGFTTEENIRRAAEYIDLFLYDFKCADDAVHQEMTGVSNEGIIRNLKLLDTLDKNVVLRCPIIPDVNLNDGHFEKIAALASELSCITEIDLLPYHPLGVSKSERLGKEIRYDNRGFLEKSELEPYAVMLREKTGKKVVL